MARSGHCGRVRSWLVRTPLPFTSTSGWQHEDFQITGFTQAHLVFEQASGTPDTAFIDNLIVADYQGASLPAVPIITWANQRGIEFVHRARLPAVPIITWANPVAIPYGMALTSNQLDATANVSGSFAYNPTNGTVLNVGTNTLTVIFSPTDTNDYSSVTNSVSLVVLPECVSPPSGLISWWPANGNALDIVSGNNGTLENGVSYTVGEVGQAFSFDGSTGWIDIPNASSLNPIGPFSVEFWENANPSQSGSLFLVVDKSHGFVDETGWLFQSGVGTGVLGFGFGNGSSFVTVSTTNSILDSQWHHVAGVWTGSEIEYLSRWGVREFCG